MIISVQDKTVCTTIYFISLISSRVSWLFSQMKNKTEFNSSHNQQKYNCNIVIDCGEKKHKHTNTIFYVHTQRFLSRSTFPELGFHLYHVSQCPAVLSLKRSLITIFYYVEIWEFHYIACSPILTRCFTYKFPLILNIDVWRRNFKVFENLFSNYYHLNTTIFYVT